MKSSSLLRRAAARHVAARQNMSTDTKAKLANRLASSSAELSKIAPESPKAKACSQIIQGVRNKDDASIKHGVQKWLHHSKAIPPHSSIALAIKPFVAQYGDKEQSTGKGGR